MCFDIKVTSAAQFKRLLQYKEANVVKQFQKELMPKTDLPLYHVSAFTHPKLLIYTQQSPDVPTVATWGLVPSWVKTTQQQQELWNKTLNARSETLFELPSFKQAAMQQRCLVYVDGFYEHHHYKGKTYPFYISSKNQQPLALAGVWNSWEQPETGAVLATFSIVTTKANSLLQYIHNNPKLAAPRMPVILPKAVEDVWLHPVDPLLASQYVQPYFEPYAAEALKAHTVAPLRGKNYNGNVEACSAPFTYAALQHTSQQM